MQAITPQTENKYIMDSSASTQSTDDPLKLSPTTPSPLSVTTIGSSARRPPRKSTLTQQQKNQKRQRATQDQLSTLEVEFNKDPTPTAAVRERIAQDINMTERSVQIWFQNRRAKIKTIAKKNMENGEDLDSIPESMRKYLALQAFETGKPFPTDIVQTGPMGLYGDGMLVPSGATPKVAITHFNCNALNIGTWRRVGQNRLDLMVFYSPSKATITYYIHAEQSGFKIEYPFSSIESITLNAGDGPDAIAGTVQSGGLVVELSRPPTFSMDCGSGVGFYQCPDFTEDRQASQILTHHIGGDSKILNAQLTKLISLDSFRNRHMNFGPNLTIPGPLNSPLASRPSSQPNHLVHPHIARRFVTQPTVMGPPPPRGHKRQRSRSVPAAIDFSQFRQQPIPSFLFQQDLSTATPLGAYSQNPLFAPIPQQAVMPMAQPFTGFDVAPLSAALEHPLELETSPRYNFDFPQGAMSSTTTANSPSEYESTFLSSAPPSDVFSSAANQTPFSSSFLSPMADPSSALQAPVSPLSVHSHNEPLIANQSPPLGSSIGRSVSADPYSMSNVPDSDGLFVDDSYAYNDFYAKQQFTLPFRNSMNLNSQPALIDNFDYSSMLQFAPGDINSMYIMNSNQAFAENS